MKQYILFALAVAIFSIYVSEARKQQQANGSPKTTEAGFGFVESANDTETVFGVDVEVARTVSISGKLDNAISTDTSMCVVAAMPSDFSPEFVVVMNDTTGRATAYISKYEKPFKKKAYQNVLYLHESYPCTVSRSNEVLSVRSTLKKDNRGFKVNLSTGTVVYIPNNGKVYEFSDKI